MPMQFSKRRTQEPEINLIPFIDVLLVILIFLVLTTTYNRFTELQLNLPVAHTDAMRERPNEVPVLIAGDGRYAVDGIVLNARSVQAVATELQRAATRHGGAQAVVVISADAGATHQAVVTAMEAARHAGLSRITFATQANGSSDVPDAARAASDASPPPMLAP